MSKLKSFIFGFSVILLYYFNNAIGAALYPLFSHHILILNFIVLVVTVMTIIEIFVFKLYRFIEISSPSIKKLGVYLLLTTVYAAVLVLVFDHDNIDRKFSLLMFIPAVVLGPIVEELIFRGIPLNIFRQGNVNKWLGVLLSTLFFGIVHLFPFYLVALHSFVFGFVLALIYLKEKNIIYCIFIHMWYNLIVCYVLPFI